MNAIAEMPAPIVFTDSAASKVAQLIDEEGNPDLKQDLEVVVRETKRCREIVKGLLDFARQTPPKPRW